MKKLDSLFLKVFMYGLPLVAGLAVFCYFSGVGTIDHCSGFLRFLNRLAGLVFATWMALSLYLSLRLIVSGPFRDQVITKITFMRERDEREAMLSGKAAKAVFLTSLAFLILLFCLSCFQVSFYRLPPEKAINGKTGVVSLGLGFSILENVKQGRPDDTIQRKEIFSYNRLPLSSASIILILIMWQIIAYNYSMRRLMK